MSAALQMVLSLAVVLAAIGGAAYAARRLGFSHKNSAGPVKVIASQPVGPKERIVVVEIEGQRYILGVAPGSVNVVHAPR